MSLCPEVTSPKNFLINFKLDQSVIIHATISQTEAFWFLYIGSIGTELIYYRLMTCDDSVIVFVVSDFPPRLTAPELLSDDQHHSQAYNSILSTYLHKH